MTLVPLETLVAKLVDSDLTLVKYRDYIAISRGEITAWKKLWCPEAQAPCSSACIFFHLAKSVESNIIKITLTCRATAQHFLVELK